MTLICPRCAARVPVAAAQAAAGAGAATTCPACGTRVALPSSGPNESARRPPSSPETRIGPVKAPSTATEPDRRSDRTTRSRDRERERDLPFPKRAVADADLHGFSPPRIQTGMVMPGDSLKKSASAASRPQVLVPRLTPALLRDLPTAVGVSPRRGRLKAAQSSGAMLAPVVRPDVEAPRAASEPRIVALRQSRPDLPALTGSPAAPSLPITAGPSDRTTPDTAEPVEPRAAPAAAQPSTTSPAALPGPPAPAGELIEPIAVSLPPDLAEVAVSSPGVAPVATRTPQPAALRTPAPAPTAAATPAPQAAAATSPRQVPPELTAPLPPATSVQTAPSAEGSEPSGPVPEPSDAVPAAPAAPAEPAEAVEMSPSQVDLGEPPTLPMGWIIGALFVLALLLTLWIANRAGMFGPPPGPPPPESLQPRMP